VSATENSASTSAAGSAGINDCYLPVGTTWSDSSGNGTISSNCSWQ
jgi:hypothetical protein